MVNVTNRRCEHEEGCKLASFGRAGDCIGRFWVKHEEEGMLTLVLAKLAKREQVGCGEIPSLRCGG